MKRIFSLLLAATALAGCVTVPQRPAPLSVDPLEAQAEREARLAKRDVWRLTGRIAVSDGRDGGSGRLEWIQRGERYEITVNAPVTRRSWRLQGEPGLARLDGLEGGSFTGESAEALLQQHLAWTVPLRDLADWARGMRAAGAASIRFSENGLPAKIEQNGWSIEYRSFDTARNPPLPTRVFTTRGERRVRLQVDSWSFEPDSP